MKKKNTALPGSRNFICAIRNAAIQFFKLIRKFEFFNHSSHVFSKVKLSLNGSIMNADGFLASGRFVSHVTGFATLFGVAAANRKFYIAVGVLTVPIFFCQGDFSLEL